MRTMFLIAAAGLTGMVATTPARAQYYGWGYYAPYYPIPYGYYPDPYYPPPPIYDAPPRRVYRPYPIRPAEHRYRPVRRRAVDRALVNPLLGPLPGTEASRRR